MDEAVLPIRSGDDVVRVRQQVRVAAADNGLSLVDQTKLVTAASELARNTLIHGGGGAATVEVLKSPNGRTGVKLSFTDQGPGIPTADRSRATERFFRGEAARSTPGSGLGLALVLAVAQLHGGTLRLEDAGLGLRATLSLPASA